MKKIILCCLIISTFFTSNISAQTFSVTGKKYVLPVVQQKGFTGLVRLKIDIPPVSEKIFLQQLHLSLKGNTHITDIEFLKIFYTPDSNYLTEDKMYQAAHFATESVGNISSDDINVTGNLRIKNKTGYIWIGVQLSTGAVPGNKINIDVTGITINNNRQSIITAPTPPSRVASAVRQLLQDNVHTSRIPGIATATNGDLLAIYDARYDSKRDLQGDIDIALNRSTDKGKTWLPMQIIMDMGTWGNLPEKFNGVSDACILADKKTGTIYVAGLWMYGVIDSNGIWLNNLTDSSTNWNHQWRNKGSLPGFNPKETSQFLIVKSTDNGKTWSTPINLTKMCKKEDWWLWAPAPGSGIQLTDGTLVFPTQGRDKTGKPFSNITYSKDGGNTWTTSNPASDEATTECGVAQLSDGSIMLNMRTNANKGINGPDNGRTVVTTGNLGKTWATHNTSRKALPEPVCMASLYKHEFTLNGKKQAVLLFLNPNSTSQRRNITLKVSYDDGKTWPAEKFILLDELSGSGYSSITSVDNNTIGILYESSQAQLVFQQININELIQ